AHRCRTFRSDREEVIKSPSGGRGDDTTLGGAAAVRERPMELLVEQPGTYVGRRSERIRVSIKGETLDERPLYGLEGVLIASSGVSPSSDLVRECAERGIPIHFLSRSGTPYARLIAPGLTGTVRTRREQLLASGDGRGVLLAKAWATGKLNNQANLLRYMVKN